MQVQQNLNVHVVLWDAKPLIQTIDEKKPGSGSKYFDHELEPNLKKILHKHGIWGLEAIVM